MPAPQIISELVERFKYNLDDYKQGNYNETQVRREFIDPFFKALGWDVSNEKGYAEAYKDVIHEFSLKTKDKAEAPDYLFRIGGTKKFFVEAKKPSVNLKADISPAFQLRRYAWSAKLPLSVLTDFEELSIYDCRVQPKKTDKSSTARINYFTFEEYIDRWDEIENVFSREAILKGSFDKYAESNKGKRGTAEVDDAFLKEIEKWREVLARNIALRNENLSNRELNFAVQKTIDRIIFMRICEDRGIEDYGQLMNLQNGANIYQRLLQIFTRADEKYNSGLFHFENEKDRDEEPDRITPAINIDDDKLKEIIKNLYYPDSPYEFSVLPSDILGHVYEQFLGKVIRLTPSHRAVVEEKPEVKKAGGVYYTPTYIVDYIVKNTLGKKLEEIEQKYSITNGHSERNEESHAKSTPQANDIKKAIKEASKIKVLDPACGSGSFLIGAYQYLLDWHIKLYTFATILPPLDKEKAGVGSSLYQTKENEYRLTTAEKKRILLNNIYGVDIDSQAVEVTKLSLLLKVLEGETDESLNTQLSMFRERALPDLSSNIKCGNSLIGPDFYDQTELNLDEEEHYRINVFDWNEEFKEIMNDGGFDCVIGNPPYLRIQGLQDYYKSQINYLKENFESAIKRFDFYLLFLERGFKLIQDKGKLGFICPHKYTTGDFGQGLRKYFLKHDALNCIVSFGNNLIFQNVSTYTCLTFLSKERNQSFNFYEFHESDKDSLESRLSNLGDKDFTLLESKSFDSSPWILSSTKAGMLLQKIQQPQKLSDVFAKIFQGIVTGTDEIYFLKRTGIDNNSVLELYSQKEKQNVLIEKEIVKPILKGENVGRYDPPNYDYYCIYPYKLIDSKTVILEENELKEKYPHCYEYLKQYKNDLTKLRIKYKTNPKYWYSCHRGRSISDFETKKLITQEISNYPNFTLDSNNYYHNTTVYSLVPQSNNSESILFWLGVLNSSLFWFFMKNTGNVLRGGYFRFKTNYLKPFPVKRIDVSSTEDIVIHDKIVRLVNNSLTVHNTKENSKTPQEKKNLERQIAATDKQIDRLVYELYGLTEDEIKIVEESVK